MRFISFASLLIPERVREEINKRELNQLKASIETLGLLHPLITYPKEDKWILISGRRRLEAIKELLEEKKIIFFEGRPLALSYIPVLELTEPSPDRALQAEIEENTRRVPLTWQEEAKATATLISLRRQSKPDISYNQLAREHLEEHPLDQRSQVTLRQKFQMAEKVSSQLSDPEISSARSLSKAYEVAMKKEERTFQNELLRRGPVNPEITFEQKSYLETGNLQPQSFDLIILNHKTFLLQRIGFIDLWCLLKPKGNLLLFCEHPHFGGLLEWASRSSFSVCPVPFLWQTSRQDGPNSFLETQGPKKTTSPILLATKGKKGLTYPSTDLLYFPDKLNLFCHLIEITTNPGETILDPVCNDGLSLRAARLLKRKAVGFSSEKESFDLAYNKIFGD